MREIKFKVYYEAEINGETIRGIEEPCSWFLLTQAGKIMEYGPCRPPSRPNKGYKKLVPLFYIGLLDKNGREVYAGDIFQTPYGLAVVEWIDDDAAYKVIRQWDNRCDSIPCSCEVIGNVFKNPELLKH